MIDSICLDTTQQQKKHENLLFLNWLKIKYVEFKKCMSHVKLSVYYTVSFTCNTHFLKSTCFIFNQFESNKVPRFFCCWVYITVDSRYLKDRIHCTLLSQRICLDTFLIFSLQFSSYFLAYRIRKSTCFTWTDNSYLTHVISPGAG